jgi:DNA repair protein SbcD/Mre11
VEIKVLHCSDIHLDCCYPALWGKGSQRRQEMRDLFARIIALVPAHRVDMVLIAGDLFNLDTLNPLTLISVKEQLKSIDPIPVYLSPGNRDPFCPESPYAYSEWPPNVFIFNTNRFKSEEVAGKNTFIYGAANKSTEDTYGALKILSLRKKEGIHIALFHGAYMDKKPDSKAACLPFNSEDLKKCRAHYLGLGHFHEKQCLDASDRFHYSGAPEFASLLEEHEKGVLIATVSTDKTVTSFVPMWKRKMVRHTIDCSLLKDWSEVMEAVKRLSQNEAYREAIVDLSLTGSLKSNLLPEREALKESLGTYFFSLTIRDETFPGYALKLLREGRTSMAAFASKVEREMSQAPEDEQGERAFNAASAKLAVLTLAAGRKVGL